MQMTVDGHTLYFSYDAMGTPLSVNYDGTEYFYTTNLQGDVTGIVDVSGSLVAEYEYAVWGSPKWNSSYIGTTLEEINPLRYRGYVYDEETGLYYLQSRYYNPEWGRFINADGLTSTGQGILGHNMYAYCNNNPVIFHDPSGTFCAYSLMESDSGSNVQFKAWLSDQHLNGVDVDTRYFSTPAVMYSVSASKSGLGAEFGISGSHSELSHGNITINSDVFFASIGAAVGLNNISAGAGIYLLKERFSVDIGGNASFEVGVSVGFGAGIKITPFGFKAELAAIVGLSISITWDLEGETIYFAEIKDG